MKTLILDEITLELYSDELTVKQGRMVYTSTLERFDVFDGELFTFDFKLSLSADEAKQVTAFLK